MGKKNKKKKVRKADLPEKTPEKSIFNKYFFIFSVLIISVTVFISYSETENYPFQFDDVHHISENPNIRDFSRFTEPGFWFHFYQRAPAQFTLAIDHSISGHDPSGYRFTNIFIHILTSISVLIFVFILLKEQLRSNEFLFKNKYRISLITALIFALHPLQTESVTYIVQRMESLAFLFYILSLTFYIIFRSYGIMKDKRAAGLILFAVFAILSVLTKQTSYTLPLTIILTELLVIRDKKGNMNKILVISGFSVLFITAVAGLFFDFLPGEQLAEASRHEYFLTQMTVIPKYLRLMILPYGQNLDHHIAIVSNVWKPSVVWGIILILSLFYVSYILYKKNRPLLSFSILWFFSVISLRSGILPISDLMYEHRLYPALAGFGMFLSVVILLLSDKIAKKYNFKYFALFFTAGIIIIYSYLTYQRNKVWESNISLWNDCVKKSPGKFRPNYNYAEALKKKGYSDTALRYYLKANSINDKSYGLCNNIANIYAQNKDYEPAEKFYERALDLKPDYSKAKNNLANLYIKTKRFEKAERLYIEIISSGKDILNPCINLGSLYYMTANYNAAAKYYHKALEVDPSNLQAKNNLDIIERNILNKKQ